MQPSQSPFQRFRFQTTATEGRARLGVLHTAHGDLRTPAFMAVGTVGSVKGMTAQAVRETGTECVLNGGPLSFASTD